jgi:hypothetical protein
MALLVFVDDSTCKIPTVNGAAKRRWYGYAGLAIQDVHLPALDRKFEDLKTIYGFPTRLSSSSNPPSLDAYREAKYNPTKQQWMHSNLIDDRRRSFFEESIKIISNLSGLFLFSYYDESCDSCGEAIAKSRALENLYERINAVAIDQNSSIGIVVCDIEGSQSQVHQLITKATGIARFGSWFQRDMKTNLYPVLLTADSNVHAGLQIIDIALGSLTKMLHNEPKYAPPIWDAASKISFERGGIVKGWGVKLRSKDATQMYTRLGIK